MNKMLTAPQSFFEEQLSLLDKRTMADFTIEVRHTTGHKQFSVHKCMLAAHSDVFRAIFTHENMRESIESRLVIEEFFPAPVYSMLKYIYIGILKTSDLSDHSEELLKLSEKYGLLHVKSMCLPYLQSRIGLKTVCEILALSDLYDAETLRSACTTFIGSYKEDVIGSNDWAELKKSSPRLVFDVLEKWVLNLVNDGR